MNFVFCIVDLETGEKFGRYHTIDEAKAKAKYYACEFKHSVAIIDGNDNVRCGYTTLGKEITPNTQTQYVWLRG